MLRRCRAYAICHMPGKGSVKPLFVWSDTFQKANKKIKQKQSICKVALNACGAHKEEEEFGDTKTEIAVDNLSICKRFDKFADCIMKRERERGTA